MKIAFYLEDFKGFGWMAAAFVQSARHYGPPGLRIVQLSPPDVERVQDVDELFTWTPAPELTFFGRYFASELMYHQPPMAEDAAVRDEVMFCNVDMLFVRPWTWPLFTSAPAPYGPDAMLPHIKDDRWKWDGAMCVVASSMFLARVVREPASWGAVSLPIEQQLQCLANAVQAHDVSVGWLPGDVWSYVPRAPGDIGDRAVLVHYRGPRKDWMARRLGMVAAPADWAAQRQETHPGTVGARGAP